MPPLARPYPRFIADSSQEGKPYGRWEERMREHFGRACEGIASDAGAPLDPETLRWFPERGYGGRIYVPVTARGTEAVADEGGEAVVPEYFGWVSFHRPDDGEPGDIVARADFTNVTADSNPGWKIDLTDDVIAKWRAEAGRGGDVTLIWGLPLKGGAVAATAELDGEVIDQAPVQDGRFTLVAVDAVTGFGDDLFLEVRLWDRTLSRMVAAESLYD